jgi:phosphoribosylformylglycinamidine synthase
VIQQGWVLSAHDISDGGIAVALAEMTFGAEIGIQVQVPSALATEKTLFSETGGFILEVAKDKLAQLAEAFATRNVPLIHLGKTTKQSVLQIQGVIDLPVTSAQRAWENGLREKCL